MMNIGIQINLSCRWARVLPDASLADMRRRTGNLVQKEMMQNFRHEYSNEEVMFRLQRGKIKLSQRLAKEISQLFLGPR